MSISVVIPNLPLLVEVEDQYDATLDSTNAMRLFAVFKDPDGYPFTTFYCVGQDGRVFSAHKPHTGFRQPGFYNSSLSQFGEYLLICRRHGRWLDSQYANAEFPDITCIDEAALFDMRDKVLVEFRAVDEVAFEETRQYMNDGIRPQFPYPKCKWTPYLTEMVDKGDFI